MTSVVSDTRGRPVVAPASKQDAERESVSGPAAAGKGPEIVGENNSKEKQMESNTKR